MVCLNEKENKTLIKNHRNKLVDINYNGILYYYSLSTKLRNNMFKFFSDGSQIKINFNTFNNEYIPLIYKWEIKMRNSSRKTIQEMFKIVFSKSDRRLIDLEIFKGKSTIVTNFYKQYLYSGKRGYDTLLFWQKHWPIIITYILTTKKNLITKTNILKNNKVLSMSF